MEWTYFTLSLDIKHRQRGRHLGSAGPAVKIVRITAKSAGIMYQLRHWYR